MLQSPQAPAAVRAEPLPKEQQLTLRGRVLLAEDVPDVHEAVARVLRAMNLEVEIAENGRLACEMAEKSMAEERPYDLILMDIQMPELNGYEATQRLRRIGWQGPIVALTAHAMLGDREKCLDAGCSDYMAKPITAAGLRDILARYLGPAAAPPAQTPPAGLAAAGPAGLFGSGPLDAAVVAELVEAFAGELPDRARLIEDALRSGDCRLLAELAHQLKGTAGIYGFTRIADAARAICQRATEEQDLEQLQAAVEELARLCGQAAGGGWRVARGG
jgi:CheY-like chemotaxis protein